MNHSAPIIGEEPVGEGVPREDTIRQGDRFVPNTDDASASRELCDMCGAPNAVWRKCKLICLTCGTIVKSCADL